MTGVDREQARAAIERRHLRARSSPLRYGIRNRVYADDVGWLLAELEQAEADLELSRAANSELASQLLDAEARAANAENALREIEWCWDGASDRCPSCGLTEPRGHDRSCTIGAALSASGEHE